MLCKGKYFLNQLCNLNIKICSILNKLVTGYDWFLSLNSEKVQDISILYDACVRFIKIFAAFFNNRWTLFTEL